MIAPTLTRFEEAISKVIESEDVADIEQFMEELTSYGITEISQLECGINRFVTITLRCTLTPNTTSSTVTSDLSYT